MTIQINSLTELLTIFSADSTVQGFEEGVIVKNADGSGEVIMMNVHHDYQRQKLQSFSETVKRTAKNP
jgi:hypothetical protein